VNPTNQLNAAVRTQKDVFGAVLKCQETNLVLEMKPWLTKYETCLRNRKESCLIEMQRRERLIVISYAKNLSIYFLANEKWERLIEDKYQI
jgi:hypothetical protein